MMGKIVSGRAGTETTFLTNKEVAEYFKAKVARAGKFGVFLEW